jgi:SAM-dependent methyltransferase
MESGSIVQKHVAYIDEDAGVRSRVAFQTGDACNLGEELGKFDAILASNLLCRLPKPRKFLLDSKKFLNPKGILVLVSPYSWLDEYTKREEWIGGVTDEAGNLVDSYSAVKSILEKDFELLHKSDMPFLIREHARKYQWGYSDATVWRLKA